MFDLDLRRRSVRFHPILRQAIYRIFQTFPDSVQHDMRICFGREFRREQKDYYAFCEFFMAGEYELASQIHNNERITYSLLIKSQGMLRNFITNCPLTCKPAVPRLLRISAMLMHTDLKPVARERFAEIIRFINSSPDYSPSDRRELLSYAYALRANEDFYVLDKMGASIKRAYDLFKGVLPLGYESGVEFSNQVVNGWLNPLPAQGQQLELVMVLDEYPDYLDQPDHFLL